jgi:hypothetical protein
LEALLPLAALAVGMMCPGTCADTFNVIPVVGQLVVGDRQPCE